MIYHKILLLFLVHVGFLPNCLVAQSEDETPNFDLALHSAAQEDLYVLRNENAAIPVKQLDQIEWYVDLFGLEKKGTFYKTLQQYTLVSESELLLETGKNTLEKNWHIVAINLNKATTAELKKMESLLGQAQTILVFFDPERQLSALPWNFTKTQHLIYVSGAGDWHESLTAQLLFGGIGTKNRLPQTLNDVFQQGDGWTTEGGLRLAYAPPESEGMDGESLHSGLSQIAEDAIAAGAFPGCQVLIVKNKKVIFHKTWGHHTYEAKRKVQLDDIYDFASLTKITSALPAIMQLHGAGKIDLDAPFKTYFPKIKKSNKADLTLRSILSHHARLKPWIPYWRSTVKKNGKFKWRTFKKRKSRRFPIAVTDQLFLHRKYKKRIYRAIRRSPLNDQPGYKYSGLAFYLFPEMISQQTGEDFETYLKKTFYQPLGAHTITYNAYRHFPLTRIIPTEKDTFFRQVQIHGRVHDEGAAMMDGVSANAGLFGSANDLAKLMQMYLNKGTYGGQRFIAERSLETFTQRHYAEQDNRRGLGFDKPLLEYDPQLSSVAQAASAASYGHAGYTGTFAWVDPKEELIFIFFSNRVFPTRENRLIYELNVRPRMHKVIYEKMK